MMMMVMGVGLVMMMVETGHLCVSHSLEHDARVDYHALEVGSARWRALRGKGRAEDGYKCAGDFVAEGCADGSRAEKWHPVALTKSALSQGRSV